MTTRTLVRSSPGSALALAVVLTAGPIASAQAPIAIRTAGITIAGTSNVHDFTASTTDARVTGVKIGPAAAGDAFWEELQGQRPRYGQEREVTP